MFDPEKYGKYVAPVAAVTVVAGLSLSAPWLAVLGFTALLGSAYSAADGLLFLGPFPYAELLRNVRKYRVHLWRTAATLVAAVPTIVLLRQSREFRGGELAQAGEGVMLFVFWHLFLVVLAVTVTFLTTAVVEEREGKRLDFLLVTDLRNREIILGKTAARGAAAMGYLLPSLPFVILYPFWFGVDPAVPLFLAAYGAVTLFSIGSAAVLGSTLARTRRLGGQFHARLIMPYFFLSFLLGRLTQYPAIWFWPGTPSAPARFAVSDLIELISVGNPGSVFMQVIASVRGGLDLRPVAAALPGYAAFHVGVGLACLLAAIRLLRRVSANLAGEPPPPSVYSASKSPVTDRPVMWKEMYSRPPEWGQKKNRVAGILFLFLLVVSPAAIIAATAFSDLGGYADGVRKAARVGVPFIAAMGMLAGLTIGGACVARERDRDTLTVLVLTDLSPREILLQKWLGVLGQLRYTFYWLGILGAACVVARVFPWYSFAALLVTMLVGVAWAVAVGLWVSSKAASVEKASRTLAFVLAFGLTGMITAAAFTAAWAGQEPIPAGPLGVAVILPAGMWAVTHAGHADAGGQLLWGLGVVAGWGLYSACAYFLFNRAVRRFEAAIQSA